MSGRRWAVLSVGVAAGVVTLYGVAVRSRFTWLYLGTLVLSVAIAVSVDRRVGLTPLALVLLVVAGIGYLAAGVVIVGGDPEYTMWLIQDTLKLDHVPHAFASLAATRAAERPSADGRVGWAAELSWWSS